MKAVTYARDSSDNQREESIEGQLRECEEYAERNGIAILKTYVDRALSAKTDHRPGFRQMIKDSGKGLFDVVIIGEYRYRDIVRDGAIPAIIPADLFDRVQERMKKNKKAPARKKAKAEEYLLTTKLFCGCCGAPMVGESGTSRTNTVHRCYKCATAKKKRAVTKRLSRKSG